MTAFGRAMMDAIPIQKSIFENMLQGSKAINLKSDFCCESLVSCFDFVFPKYIYFIALLIVIDMVFYRSLFCQLKRFLILTCLLFDYNVLSVGHMKLT